VTATDTYEQTVSVTHHNTVTAATTCFAGAAVRYVRAARRNRRGGNADLGRQAGGGRAGQLHAGLLHLCGAYVNSSGVARCTLNALQILVMLSNRDSASFTGTTDSQPSSAITLAFEL
jgi:hypothetical protein